MSKRLPTFLSAFGKVTGYSKGMKRKLTIAAGIIHRPSILFLDEPTTGIDVASARQLRQLVAELNRSGTTIFLTTHYIEEAERLCGRIAFIVSGRIVRIDSVENLVHPLKDRHVVRISFEGVRAAASCPHSLRTADAGQDQSFLLPLTYGVDVLHWAVNGEDFLPLMVDFGLLSGFCALLFAASLWNIKRKWIL